MWEEDNALAFTMWVKHVRKTPPVPMRIIHLGTTGSVNDDIIILETDGASNRLRLEHRLGHGFHRRLPGTFSVQCLNCTHMTSTVDVRQVLREDVDMLRLPDTDDKFFVRRGSMSSTGFELDHGYLNTTGPLTGMVDMSVYARQYVHTEAELPSSTWAHVMAVHDGFGMGRIYIDGVLQAEARLSIASDVPPGIQFYWHEPNPKADGLHWQPR